MTGRRIVGRGRDGIPSGSKRDDLEANRLNGLMAAIAVDRNVDAFEQIYQFYFPKLRAYMMRVTKDGTAAEEIAQEAMEKVWRKAAQFDPEKGGTGTWIFTIARNMRIDRLRQGPGPSFDPTDPFFEPEPIEAADAAVMRWQEAELLYEAMGNLNPQQYEVLRLSFFENMPHSAIALSLQVPIGTVKSRIRTACEKLRTLLRNT